MQRDVSFSETYQTAFNFLANPCNSGNRLVSKTAELVFAEKLPSARNEAM